MVENGCYRQTDKEARRRKLGEKRHTQHVLTSTQSRLLAESFVSPGHVRLPFFVILRQGVVVKVDCPVGEKAMGQRCCIM